MYTMVLLLGLCFLAYADAHSLLNIDDVEWVKSILENASNVSSIAQQSFISYYASIKDLILKDLANLLHKNVTG